MKNKLDSLFSHKFISELAYLCRRRHKAALIAEPDLTFWLAIPPVLENACGMEIIMRVIAGKAKSLPLKTLEGLDTRPTTDKIKETLFNIISPGLFDSMFLDLFAGSGQMGLEAVSRGARYAVFVDNGKKAGSLHRGEYPVYEVLNIRQSCIRRKC